MHFFFFAAELLTVKRSAHHNRHPAVNRGQVGQKPRSDCQPKSDFFANPIEIRSYLDSLNGSKLHEIRFEQIRFELHSYVVWNPIQIAFLEIRFNLTAPIGCSVAFSRPHAT